MTGLKISRGLTLPLDYVTKTAAIIAKRRVGKTYTGAVLAEELCKAGIPWYALDPTGAWWGLRASADGKKAGLPVIVLGGAHGDLPITEHDGKAIAELVVEEPAFYVIDLASIDESHAATVRFATAFLDRLYRLKDKHREPLHGFWDEADIFAPQKPGPEETKMLGAAESIVRRGGLRGLGTTLITQRAAVLNKNVLTQLDILLMLRTVSPQDQDAVDEYIKRNASPEQRKEIMGSLASLRLGEAWLYGPGEEPELLKRVQIRERRTFNSSATPKVGEQRIEPTKLADVDLDALRARFAQQVEKAKAEDPAHLRREIQRLTRELADAQAATPEPERVEVAVLTGEHVDRLVAALGEFDAGKEAAVLDLMRPHATVAKAADEILELLRAHQAPAPTTARPGRVRAAATPAPPGGSAAPPPVPAAQTHEYELPDRPELNGAEPQLKAGARRILDELATVHPLRLTRSQVGLATGMKITGGTFGTYWSTLKRAGYIDESGGDTGVTDTGLERAGVTPSRTPRTPEEMIAIWSSKLKRGARDMLQILANVYPEGMARDELAERLDMAASGGTFGTYLSTLRRNGLIEDSGGVVRAHPNLYVGA